MGHNSLNCPSLRIAQQYQRNLYIIEKYFQCATNPLLTMRVYLHSFSRCCLPNTWSIRKFQENLNIQQFKVIQGQVFWYHLKNTCNFLLVISGNHGHILHRFWDTATYWLKTAHILYPSLIQHPRSIGSLWNFTASLTTRELESWGYSVVKVAWS